MTRKWWATALMIGSVVGVACLLIGSLGTKLGVFDFTIGLSMLGVGAVLATIVFFLGVIALIVCMMKGMQAERGAIIVGLVISVGILGLMGSQYVSATSVPPIHNISTDTDNPPKFDKVVGLRAASESNPLELTEEVIDAQKKAYPQVRPLVSQTSQADMLANAEKVLEGMGMEIVSVDAANGRVEATDTTFWFGFKDDVVVRVRSEGGGSVVDVRSVSRVGQSDLGKNAARISEILAGLGSS